MSALQRDEAIWIRVSVAKNPLTLHEILGHGLHWRWSCHRREDASTLLPNGIDPLVRMLAVWGICLLACVDKERGGAIFVSLRLVFVHKGSCVAHFGDHIDIEAFEIHIRPENSTSGFATEDLWALDQIVLPDPLSDSP